MAIPAVIACVAAAFTVTATLQTDLTQVGMWADQASYLSAALSLAYDHDLVWDSGDLERFRSQGFAEGPRGIILVSSGRTGRWYHSVAWAYPLAASPFARLAGYRGLLVFNAILFGLLVFIIFDVLWAQLGAPCGLILAIVMTVFSLPLAYVFVMMSDLWNTVLLTGCFYVMFRGEPCVANHTLPSGSRRRMAWRPALVGLAGTLVVIDKAVHSVMLVLLFALIALQWGRRGLVTALGASVLVVCTYWAFNYAAIGELTIRSHARQCFSDSYPEDRLHQVTGDSARRPPFEPDTSSWQRPQTPERPPPVGGASGVLGRYAWAKHLFRLPDMDLLLRNARFFFVGRYTGLLWHQAGYLACIFLFLTAPRDRRRFGLACALALDAYAWLTLFPHHWSGAHALGNRYFMPVVSVAVFLIPFRPRRLVAYPVTIGALALAVLGYWPIISHPIENNLYTELHIGRLPFCWGPLEDTLLPQVLHVLKGNLIRVHGGGAYVLGREPYVASQRGVVIIPQGYSQDIVYMTAVRPESLPVCVQAGNSPIRFCIGIGGDSFNGTLDAGEVANVVFIDPKPCPGSSYLERYEFLLDVKTQAVDGYGLTREAPSYLWIGHQSEYCFPVFDDRRFDMTSHDPIGVCLTGWASEEQWGSMNVRWTIGPEAVTGIRPHATRHSLLIRARAKTVWPDQSIEVLFNDSSICRWGPVAIDSFSVHEAIVPMRLVRKPPRVNLITWRFAHTGRPTLGALPHMDTRPLSVVFDWLEVLSVDADAHEPGDSVALTEEHRGPPSDSLRVPG